MLSASRHPNIEIGQSELRVANIELSYTDSFCHRGSELGAGKIADEQNWLYRFHELPGTWGGNVIREQRD